MIEMTTHVGILYVKLFIPDAQSLKAKRAAIKPLKEKIRNKFNVSVSELGEQDKWQIAVLGFSMISSDQRYIDGALQHVLTVIDHYHAAEIVEHDVEFF